MALLCGRRDFCRALATQRVLLRSAVDLLQHDHAAVRADVLAVAEALSADHETYEVLLHSGALQGTLDLLERAALAALNPTGETLKPQNKTPSPLGRRAWTTRKLAFAIVIVIIAVLVTVII